MPNAPNSHRIILLTLCLLNLVLLPKKVHESVAEDFLANLKREVGALKAGLPWDEGVNITPLPEPNKPKYLEDLIRDAVEHGASVINADTGGGSLRGSLFQPAIVYPVTPAMRLWREEQFGPVIPVATFKDLSEVKAAAKESWNGQQSAIFTSDQMSSEAASLVDSLSTIVGRININAQCQRSPDSFPFSGRRSSAMGTMVNRIVFFSCFFHTRTCIPHIIFSPLTRNRIHERLFLSLISACLLPIP